MSNRIILAFLATLRPSNCSDVPTLRPTPPLHALLDLFYRFWYTAPLGVDSACDTLGRLNKEMRNDRVDPNLEPLDPHPRRCRSSRLSFNHNKMREREKTLGCLGT